MYCTNCGKEIEDNSKFCTNCGDPLQPTQRKLKNKIIASVIILLSVVLCSLGAIHLKLTNDLKHNITSIEQAKIMPVYMVLNKLIKQDEYLTEYIKKNPNTNIDEVFEIFYKNLLAFTGKETEFESRIQYNYSEDEMPLFNIEIQVEQPTEEYAMADKAKLIKPQTDIISLLFDAEMGFHAGINYDYLVKYSPNLSKPWQDYLTLKQREYNDRRGLTYYLDGYPPNQTVLVNWIIAIDEFFNKYPDFPMNYILKDNYKTYVSDMLRTDIFDSNNIILPEIKKSYEKFLAGANKNTEEYKSIENWYNTLKKNGFRYSANFYKHLYEIDKNENNKETYERMKAIEDFENLKFDKKDFVSVYDNACEYCREHMSDRNEEGVLMNGGSGSFELCVKDLFEKQGTKYLKIYNATWDYCTVTHGYKGLAGIRKCTFEEFDKFKQ